MKTKISLPKCLHDNNAHTIKNPYESSPGLKDDFVSLPPASLTCSSACVLTELGMFFSRTKSKPESVQTLVSRLLQAPRRSHPKTNGWKYDSSYDILQRHLLARTHPFPPACIPLCLVWVQTHSFYRLYESLVFEGLHNIEAESFWFYRKLFCFGDILERNPATIHRKKSVPQV